jgi:hypothetical protein
VERLKDPELLKYLPKITRECPPDARIMSTGTVQKDKKGNITRHTLANLRKVRLTPRHISHSVIVASVLPLSESLPCGAACATSCSSSSSSSVSVYICLTNELCPCVCRVCALLCGAAWQELKLRKSKLAICEGRVERLKRQVFELEDVVAAKSR